MPGSIHSNTTGGSVGLGGSTVALGGTAVYSYGAGGADGGGWRRRNFVGSAGAAARAGGPGARDRRGSASLVDSAASRRGGRGAFVSRPAV